jgi:hypothetical protein
VNFSVLKNRVSAQSLSFASNDSGFSGIIDNVSIHGIHWLWLIKKLDHVPQALAAAEADANGIDIKFPDFRYGFTCKRLRASIPDSMISADGIEYRPLVDDKRFFKNSRWRATRYYLRVPQCRVAGWAGMEMLENKTCSARSIELSDVFFDALVDKYAPLKPRLPPQHMPNEFLVSIPMSVQLDSIDINNGKIIYGESYIIAHKTAVVRFDNVRMQVRGISNRQNIGNAVVHAQADFMGTGKLKMELSMPLFSHDFNCSYSISLGAMAMNKINPFLENSQFMRIDSGTVQQVFCNINISSGNAHGTVQALYKDLKLTLLVKSTGSDDNIIKEIGSFYMNTFSIRSNNMPDTPGSVKVGITHFVRKKKDTFLQVLWFSARSGILDLLLTK